MNLENAKITDIDRIVQIIKEITLIHLKSRPDLFKERTTSEIIEDIKQKLELPEERIIIAKDEKIIKGILICKLKIIKNHSNLKNSKILWIEEIGVKSQFQKQGIGRILMNKAVDFAKQNNCERVDLNCWKLNENAIKFYKKIGMLEQRVIMELKIGK